MVDVFMLLSLPINVMVLGLRLMMGVMELRICDEEMEVKVIKDGVRVRVNQYIRIFLLCLQFIEIYQNTNDF